MKAFGTSPLGRGPFSAGEKNYNQTNSPVTNKGPFGSSCLAKTPIASFESQIRTFSVFWISRTNSGIGLR